MSDHVYKHITVTGSSPEGIEDAVKRATKKANGSVRNMRWFEVKDIRGHMKEDDIHHWQVTVEIGFTMD